MKAIPISNGEFIHMFTKCRPPSGWPSKIAIANSGGPDSTCLLFLVKRLLSGSAQEQGLPQDIVSVSINHGLQASSTDMAMASRKVAESMGVEHVTAAIPWSRPPFPPLPMSGEAFENTARHARYHVLCGVMARVGAKAVAFGHHADDQVETALMRVANGTTELGVGGMRRCRRWGMGLGCVEGSLGWAGYEGMHRWVIRPLVDVSKDRLIATCEENELDYVLDPTNYQPGITLRNAVRQMLCKGTGAEDGSETEYASTQSSLAASISKGLKRIRECSQAFGLDITTGQKALRVAVAKLSARVDGIECTVDRALEDLTLPSPAGTFLISTRTLSEITDDAVRRSLILRITRYISFHPWGSIQADGGRRSKSLANVVSKIWFSDPSGMGVAKFNSKGGILWWPMYIQPSGAAIPVGEAKTCDKSHFGWLASRMPPFSYSRSQPHLTQDPLTVDVTRSLCLAERDAQVSILYDCRFLVRFNLARIPEDVAARLGEGGKVTIEAHTSWFWPGVWLRWEGKAMSLAALDSPAPHHWIEFDWVRTMN